MARWMKPSEEMPDCEVGDRIVGIVYEHKLRHRLVIMVAEEFTWTSPDGNEDWYSPEDCVLWAYERDIVQVAKVVDLLAEEPLP